MLPTFRSTVGLNPGKRSLGGLLRARLPEGVPGGLPGRLQPDLRLPRSGRSDRAVDCVVNVRTFYGRCGYSNEAGDVGDARAEKP